MDGLLRHLPELLGYTMGRIREVFKDEISYHGVT
jgi:hypothetical protein